VNATEEDCTIGLRTLVIGTTTDLETGADIAGTIIGPEIGIGTAGTAGTVGTAEIAEIAEIAETAGTAETAETEYGRGTGIEDATTTEIAIATDRAIETVEKIDGAPIGMTTVHEAVSLQGGQRNLEASDPTGVSGMLLHPELEARTGPCLEV